MGSSVAEWTRQVDRKRLIPSPKCTLFPLPQVTGSHSRSPKMAQSLQQRVQCGGDSERALRLLVAGERAAIWTLYWCFARFFS